MHMYMHLHSFPSDREKKSLQVRTLLIRYFFKVEHFMLSAMILHVDYFMLVTVTLLTSYLHISISNRAMTLLTFFCSVYFIYLHHK